MKNKTLIVIARQYSRNKLYTIISLISIAMAIAITLLVYSFVVKEIKTDHFHKNGREIFRLLSRQTPSDPYQAHHFGVFGPNFFQHASDIQSYVRTWEIPSNMKSDPEQTTAYPVKCLYADTTFFNIFTFPLLSGEINAHSPYRWAVISRKAAQTYFGNTNPVGKELFIQDNRWSRQIQTYQVVAVMEDIPAWSTIKTDIVLDYRYMEQFTDWNNNMQTIVYVLLNDEKSKKNTEEQILGTYRNAFQDFKGDIKLQPLYDIYYDQDQVKYFSSSDIPKGSLFFTQIVIGITLLILLLSSGSYIMIKIIQSRHNLKLFALQRSFGAGSASVWRYLWSETVIFFTLSGISGIILTILLFEPFQKMITPDFHYPFPADMLSILCFAGIIILIVLFITAILAGFYWKRLHSGIKNALHVRLSHFDIRRIIAFISIAIFCLLLMDTLLIHRQINYLKSKELGYAKNTITVIGSNLALEKTLNDCPFILSTSLGATPLPNTNPSFFKLSCFFEDSGEMPSQVEIITGDANYLDTYQITLLEGENFDILAEPKSEGVIPLLVNQKFIEQAGSKHPIGTLFRGRLGEDEDQPMSTFQIIGIVKDFHLWPLYETIPPSVICYSKGAAGKGFMNNSLTSIRYLPGKKGEVWKYLEYHKINVFYAYDYEQLYDKENAFILLIDITTFIALIIGGFGIFAFSVFFAESRKKEVALRKINGSSKWEIQMIFHRQFLKLTVFAFILTLPPGYFLLQGWLEKFAYRSPVSWYIFPGILLACLTVVYLIVTWQTQRIAGINPIECLKEE